MEKIFLGIIMALTLGKAQANRLKSLMENGHSSDCANRMILECKGEDAEFIKCLEPQTTSLLLVCPKLKEVITEAKGTEVPSYCDSQFERLCGDKGDNTKECIEKRIAEFSPFCAFNLKARLKESQKFEKCEEAMDKLCGGRYSKEDCLIKYSNRLPSECNVGSMGNTQTETVFNSKTGEGEYGTPYYEKDYSKGFDNSDPNSPSGKAGSGTTGSSKGGSFGSKSSSKEDAILKAGEQALNDPTAQEAVKACHSDMTKRCALETDKIEGNPLAGVRKYQTCLRKNFSKVGGKCRAFLQKTKRPKKGKHRMKIR